MRWRENTFLLNSFFSEVNSVPSGMSFPRPPWLRLNRLQNGVGLLGSTMHTWGMASTAACECGKGANNQPPDNTKYFGIISNRCASLVGVGMGSNSIRTNFYELSLKLIFNAMHLFK